MDDAPQRKEHVETNVERERASSVRSSGQGAGIDEVATSERLKRVGYTDQTLVLIRLIPLITVAWADGKVSDSERETILAEARGRGIPLGSAADRQLSQWLTVAPSEALCRASVEFLATTANGDLSCVLEACHQVASASGGFLGSCAISRREQDVLDRLATALVRKGIASPHR
jgi:hypothetical protein